MQHMELSVLLISTKFNKDMIVVMCMTPEVVSVRLDHFDKFYIVFTILLELE